MFRFLRLLNIPLGYYSYIWVEAKLIKETRRAMLVEFEGKQAWLPKVWIKKTRHYKEPQSGSEAISIKISEYHWTKKF